MAHWAPCCGPCRSTHWPCRRPCGAHTLSYRSATAVAPLSRHKISVTIQNPMPRALGRVTALLRLVVVHCCAVSQHSAVVLCHDTKHHIATHLASQATRVHCHSPRAQAGRIAGPTGSIAGLLDAVSHRLLRAPALPCVRIQSVVS